MSLPSAVTLYHQAVVDTREFAVALEPSGLWGVTITDSTGYHLFATYATEAEANYQGYASVSAAKQLSANKLQYDRCFPSASGNQED